MSGRNEPCSCGSGLKYKHCCAQKRTRSQWIAIAAGAAFVLFAAWGIWTVYKDRSGSRQVWSEEHGHYHTVGGSEPTPAPPPAGAPLPGKVWSAEHGHWHDADGGEIGPVQAAQPAAPAQPPRDPSLPAGPAMLPEGATAAGRTQPPGPAPVGKVWSAEHGHWHDGGAEPAPAPAAPAQQPPGPAPAGKVWSAEHGHWHDAP